jgi:hypothetical protein
MELNTETHTEHKGTDKIITVMTGKREDTHVVQSSRGNNSDYKIVLFIKIELIPKQISRRHFFQCEPQLAPS